MRRLAFVFVLVGVAVAVAIGCGGLFGVIACDGDAACPDDLVCSDDGRCVADGEGEGDEGEGDEGEGEGEGDAGEGEGEGEGEGDEGEGEGDAGEGEGEPALLASTFRVDPCLPAITGVLDPASTLLLNSDTGAISVDGTEVRGAGADVGGIAFTSATQLDGPSVGIFAVAALRLPSAATLTVVGTRPVGIAVCGDVDLAGVVQLSGSGFPGGAGAIDGVVGVEGGGGTEGGSQGYGDNDEFTGGAGGGGLQDGGDSGSTQGSFGDGPVVAGDTGNGALLPLRFFGSGGGGGADPDGAPGGDGGDGGASGGSLYVYASDTLRCSTGLLQSRGANGAAGGDRGGGGGGGAGGALFLEGTSIDVAGSCVVDVGGGRGGDSSAGTNGGAGGVGDSSSGFDCAGKDGVFAAGGGGACGRVRLRGRVVADTAAAFVSPLVGAVERVIVP